MSEVVPRLQAVLSSPPSPGYVSSVPPWAQIYPVHSPYKDAVMMYLSNLNQSELQTFKMILMDNHLLHHLHDLSWEMLNKASWAELVHLLIECHPGVYAWNWVHDILARMDKKDICSMVHTERRKILPTLEPPILRLRTPVLLMEEECGKVLEYRQRILNENCPEWDNTIWPGNQRGFLYRAVEKHQEILPCLFLPKGPQGKQPKYVVIHGIPGIGKTTLARRIMAKWACNEFYPHKFRYAFYFHCRELSWEGERSFSDLIGDGRLRSPNLVSKILSIQEHLLFVFDGFEELPSLPTVRPESLSGDWNQKLPASVLLSSLLNKRMFPEATLLILVRPASWERISFLQKYSSFVTLTGFNRNERLNYLRAYFGSKVRSLPAEDFARENSILLSMCQVPVVCWLVCHCLREQRRKMVNLTESCPNATSVFVLYLATLFRKISKNIPGRNYQAQLEGVCRLAAQGIWDTKTVFDKTDFERVMVDDTSINAFLQGNILQKVEGPRDRYVFTLFIFQEFLGALFYVLCFPQRIIYYHRLGRADIQHLITTSIQHESSKSQMGLFLFGLLNEECFHIAVQSLRCRLSLANKSKALQVITSMNEAGSLSWKDESSQLLLYLTEMREEIFVTSALVSYQKVSLKITSHETLQASAFCFKRCRAMKKVELSLQRNFSQDLWPTTMGPILGAPSLGARLKENEILLSWWQDVCSVFGTNNSLQVLVVTNSVLGDPFLQMLTYALKKPQCKLERLYFRYTNLTLHEELFYVLTENQHLRQLEIEHTRLEERVITFLCVALKSPHCHLQYLRLENCDPTPGNWLHLSSGFQKNTQLKTLLLKRNLLHMFGIDFLTLGNLRELALENCNLNDLSCERIALSVGRSETLTHLSLAGNNLTLGRSEEIWMALRYLRCPLQRLVLRGCSLTLASCLHITMALKNNKSLRSLDLSCNWLRDDGIIWLCEALPNLDCNLLVLELEKCEFTSAACQALTAMLRSYRRLRYLDLSKNSIGLLGILIMAQGLANEVLLMKKGYEEEDMYARLKGPEVSGEQLKIVEDWNSD